MTKGLGLELKKFSLAQKLIYSTLFCFISLIGSVAFLLFVDLYLHYKFSDYAILNVWGYRGPTVSHKKENEFRVVVLGGSTTFGYGVPPAESYPAQLQELLPVPVTVVNLGYNNQGSFSFLDTLKDFGYLDYDLAIFYEAYNDLGLGQSDPSQYVVNRRSYRHDSPVFLLTGYFPVFPLIFREKAMSLLSNGNLEAAYWNKEKVVFHPKPIDQAKVGVLNAAVDAFGALEKQLGSLSKRHESPKSNFESTQESCGKVWSIYCDNIIRAADFSLAKGKSVLVVTQPYISDLHVRQQSALRQMLEEKYANRNQLRYLNLGREINLKDSTLAYDGMHLTQIGNRKVAEAMVESVQAFRLSVNTSPKN